MKPLPLLTLIICFLTISCDRTTIQPVNPDYRPPINLKGIVLDSTTLEPIFTGKKMYVSLTWTDWSTVQHSQKLGETTINDDGTFDFTYTNIEEVSSLTSVMEIRCDYVRVKDIPKGQNFNDTLFLKF